MAIRAESPDVTQIPKLICSLRIIDLRISRTIECLHHPRPKLRRDPFKNRSAGKGKVKVESGNKIGRQVLIIAAIELGQSHRGIYVIEGDWTRGVATNPISQRHALGNVRADHD